MKRRALLLAVTSVPPPLPGPRQDVAGMAAWLRSGPGGAWRTAEIRVLVDPNSRDLCDGFRWLESGDYGLLTFSGHGYHDAQVNKPVLRFPGYDLQAQALVPPTGRGTAIFDACRESVTLPRTWRFNPQAITEARADRDCRQKFNDLLEDATGTAVLYSCDLDETAAESEQGGLFTTSLLRHGQGFAAGNSAGTDWLSIKAAFHAAAARTSRDRLAGDGETQTPQVYYSCDGARDLPFGV